MHEPSHDAVAVDSEKWFSTYTLLTAKRLLGHFNIQLNEEELQAAVKNPQSIYYLLLRVPLKNVFNGIILQQAHDYLTYAQKLFVDYLMSGEMEKEETSPGANTRQELEALHQQLKTMTEDFNTKEADHLHFIMTSQATLIEVAKGLQQPVEMADPRPTMDALLSPLLEEAEALGAQFRDFRTQFYNFIIRATELIKLLPDYRVNETKTAENLAALQFDSKLGSE